MIEGRGSRVRFTHDGKVIAFHRRQDRQGGRRKTPASRIDWRKNARELIQGAPIGERTFSEAAVMYVLSIEQRGKDSSRAELDIRMVDEAIGHLPLSHVHQLALSQWVEAQRGIRASVPCAP